MLQRGVHARIQAFGRLQKPSPVLGRLWVVATSVVSAPRVSHERVFKKAGAHNLQNQPYSLQLPMVLQRGP